MSEAKVGLEAAAAGSAAEAEVEDVPGASRYELLLSRRLIGITAYRRRSRRIVFLHTEIDESVEGRGFAGVIASGALADARRQGLEVIPLCPFIAAYIERHPEYEDLVAPGYRDRSALATSE